MRVDGDYFFCTRITRVSRINTEGKNKKIRVRLCDPSNPCTNVFVRTSIWFA